MQESLREKAAEAGERMSDLVAEVQAERAARKVGEATASPIAALAGRVGAKASDARL